MGMNIAEKILSRAAGTPVKPGDIAVVEVDVCVLTDMNFLPASWREVLKMRDPERVVVALDHLVPANEPLSAQAHAKAREFVARFGIKRFHDVGREQGISHVVVADNAYALPGTVMVNPDSHTCGGGFLTARRAASGCLRPCSPSPPARAGSASANACATSSRGSCGPAYRRRMCSCISPAFTARM